MWEIKQGAALSIVASDVPINEEYKNTSPVKAMHSMHKRYKETQSKKIFQ